MSGARASLLSSADGCPCAATFPAGLRACRGREPFSKGAQMTMDDDLIIWLTRLPLLISECTRH
jgi:hypothetical protein